MPQSVTSSRNTPAKNALSSLIVFAAALIFLLMTERDRGPWRIDEAHKVVDTYFFHLLRSGDLTHSDWARHIADRTNPPVGKFLFGLSGVLHGAPLPRDLSARVEEPDGSLGQGLRGDAARFDALLLASRRVSILATAATAAVIFSVAAFAAGLPAGIIGATLYLLHYLTLTFAGTAVYDPLLTFFVSLSALPLVHLDAIPPRRRILLSAAAAGLFAAAACQTRLSGALGLLVLFLLFSLGWIITRRRDLSIFIITSALTFVIAAVAVNPFYWSSIRRGDPASASAGSDSSLPLRVVERFSTQLRELSALLARQAETQEMLSSIGEKTSFAAEILLGDMTGMLMLLGWGIAFFFLATGRASRRRPGLLVMAWSCLVIVLLIAWLPIAWPRYLLVALPAAAIGGAVGWGELVSATGRTLRRHPDA